MITDAGSEPGRKAGSGQEEPAKAGHNFFSVFPKSPPSPSAATNPTSHDGAAAHGQSPLAAHSAYSTIPAINTPATVGPDALTQMLNRVQQQVQGTLADQVTPLRLAGHLSVLLIAAVILILSQVKIPEWELSLQPTPQPTAGAGSLAMSARAQDNGGLFSNDLLQRRPIFTIVDIKAQQEAPRQDITYYTVKSGDTVLGIADRYGLQPETLMWSNSVIEQNPDRLSIGDELRILPVDGVLHVVQPGETLSDLADEYDVSMDQIAAYTGNGLGSTADTLIVGRELVVPGGTREFTTAAIADYSGGAYYVDAPADGPQGSGNFSWPAAGYVSQGYWGGHPAIDIAGSVGAAVTAADGGYVVLAGGGWNGGYGNHVIIDHGNGFTTLYAHLNSIFVEPGMTVSKGQEIGTMGNTGNSTGPHLHLEVRYGGVPYNPANYLD
jgi:murein DD-endopeptidase MepM/ murein hydrolase activator NlpD